MFQWTVSVWFMYWLVTCSAQIHYLIHPSLMDPRLQSKMKLESKQNYYYNKMHWKLSTAKHSPLVFQYVRSLEHIKSCTLAIPSVRMAMKFPPNWISLMRFPWISINSLVISLPSGNAKGEKLWSGLNICVRWCYLFYEWYHVPPQWQIDRN